jgi:hypothetical protein
MKRGLTDHELELLASSSGYAVEASDGHVGEVETPLFPPDRSDPDYLVIRVGGTAGLRRPVVATVLVEEVDDAHGLVRVRGTKDEIATLPEHLPLAI